MYTTEQFGLALLNLVEPGDRPDRRVPRYRRFIHAAVERLRHLIRPRLTVAVG